MRCGAALGLIVLLLTAPALRAQDGAASSPAETTRGEIADVPFGIGESLTYRVKFGPLDVGEARMYVAGIDTIDGHPTYHMKFSIKGGPAFYKIDDQQESWLDVSLLASRRYRQDLHQGNFQRLREYELDLEQRIYYRNDGVSDSIPERALDDASFIYFIRSVLLEVGETYVWNRYFRLDRNPVILHVLRRERVKLGAGEFNTIVVRPIIKSRGIYSEGGEAEIYITDDDRRIPVQLKSKLKVGSLSLELIEYVPGKKLTPQMLGM